MISLTKKWSSLTKEFSDLFLQFFSKIFLDRIFVIPANGRLSEDPGAGENQRVRPSSFLRTGLGKRRHFRGVGSLLEMKTGGDGVCREPNSCDTKILISSGDLDCAQGS